MKTLIILSFLFSFFSYAEDRPSKGRMECALTSSEYKKNLPSGMVDVWCATTGLRLGKMDYDILHAMIVATFYDKRMDRRMFAIDQLEKYECGSPEHCKEFHYLLDWGIKSGHPRRYSESLAERAENLRNKVRPVLFVREIKILKEGKPSDMFEASSSGGNFYIMKIKDVHGEITFNALKGNLDQDCLNVIVKANRDQDDGEAEETPKFHFDDNLICESSNQISSWKQQFKKSSTLKGQMKILGKIFHSVQDFYSHSNYLEETIKNNMLKKTDVLNVLKVDELDCREVSEKYFTSNNHNETLSSTLNSKNLVPLTHLKDSESHLYWNKDFDPDYDFRLASIYSRSSFKEFEGRNYFKIIYGAQVAHTKAIFESLREFMHKTGSCK